MPIQLETENDGATVVVKATGTLVRADYPAFVAEFDRLSQSGKARKMLVDMTECRGWDAGGAWEDLKFGAQHTHDLELLAVVGEKKWKETMTRLMKPFTSATIHYFDESEMEQAREWLRSGKLKAA